MSFHLDQSQIESTKETVCNSLDYAEKVWYNVKDLLLEKCAKPFANRAILPSRIPGYPLVDSDKPAVDNFIAFVFDIRDSTKHLLQAISTKIAKVSQLQRVYYETSAVLPVIERVVADKGGLVTEFLGDGLLGFFRLSNDQQDSTIRKVGTAARLCIAAIKQVVNPELIRRYALPELRVAIGLAASKAIVTMVGSDHYWQPKAIGECVYRAAKLANPDCFMDEDTIIVDEPLYRAWPSSTTGKLHFYRTKIGDIDAFKLLDESQE